MRKLTIFLFVLTGVLIIAGIGLAFFYLITSKNNVLDEENKIIRFYNFESNSVQAVIRGEVKELDVEGKRICLEDKCIKWDENTEFLNYTEFNERISNGILDRTARPLGISDQDIEVGDKVFINLKNLGLLGAKAQTVSVVKKNTDEHKNI
jgi:hypothetical protein